MAGLDQIDSYAVVVVVHQGHLHPCRADHCDSPVILGQGGQCSCFAGGQAFKTPVLAQRQFPMVFQTINIHQLLDTVIDVLLCRSCSLPARSHVAVQRPIPMVQTVRLTKELPQFFFDKVVDDPGVQIERVPQVP